MKNLFLFISITALLISGCKEKNPDAPENESTGGSASFTADNTTYIGNVETQYFGSNEETSGFSITCQQDEPLALLQITFANEKAATTGNQFVATDNFVRMDTGTANIALSGTAIGDLEYVSKDEASGSITVKDRVLTLKDLKLTNRDGAVKTVNATIPF